MKRVIFSVFVVAIFMASLVFAGSIPTGAVSVVEKCTDSDGGINYEQRGQASDGRQGGGIDYCLNGKIREYYCDMDAFAVKYNDIDCPLGSTCKNGACYKVEVQPATSELKNNEVVVLVISKEQNFGYDSVVVTGISGGIAELTYTKKVSLKTGDVLNLDGNKFDVTVGDGVELSNVGTYVEIVEKPVEKIVYVDKIVEVEKPSAVKSIWRKIFGGTKD